MKDDFFYEAPQIEVIEMEGSDAVLLQASSIDPASDIPGFVW